MGTWADSLQHVGVPKVALQAYGYAELTIASTQSSCNLSWPTLAGIGKIESNHGRTGGAALREDGTSDPPVVGLPLDGGPERKQIRDTDDGKLDGDKTYDRAVGPMQFIPTTWSRWATDGDGDGRANPYDIDDAAVAAARYLCAGGRDLATGEGWRGAIFSYNHLDSYVQSVFTAADEYGRMSRSGG
ncbi:MAG: murein transglycosylase [Micromonosporaceae bacterium]|nr:murein transglycosylase [Micromonosporaceae bacterium]